MQPEISRSTKTGKNKWIYIGSGVFLVLILSFFLSYNLRVWAAGTLLTTQHRHWAKYTLVGQGKINELMAEINKPKVINSDPVVAATETPTSSPEASTTPNAQRGLVEVVEVSKHISETHFFKGHVMKVSDPKRVHLVPTLVKVSKGKKRGEWIHEFSERTGALGGINASGFSDPGGMSWAASPMGLVIVDGKLIQDYDLRTGETALGITYEGKLVTGSYSSEELLKMGIRDAMSFRPQLVVNGKNMFNKDSAAWGLQPRSAVGQAADGTIILIQIDGRRSHSIGASMKDMADLMLEYGAVNAMAMDGGTSAFMIHKGEVLTVSPVKDERGRFLPNAWMVY